MRQNPFPLTAVFSQSYSALDPMVHATAVAILSTGHARQSLLVTASTGCSARRLALWLDPRPPVLSNLPKLSPLCVMTDLDRYTDPLSSGTFAVDRC